MAPEQQIVYRDQRRYNYRTLGQRLGQLAGALRPLGSAPPTVAGTVLPLAEMASLAGAQSQSCG